MKRFNVTLLGATGAVGLEMLRIMEEKNFPIGELKLLSSKKSAGKKLIYNNKEYTVREACPEEFKASHIILGAAGSSISKAFIDDIKKSGAFFIDNSSAFRLFDDVPLIIPEINADDIKKSTKIIANPNCSTIITLMAAYPIHKIYPIKSMVVSTYQAVSGAGVGGPKELKEQMENYIKGIPSESHVFSHTICGNLIPQIGDFTENGYTQEEMKLQNEGRKILHQSDLKVSCTCVRVPIMRSHSISANLFFDSQPDLKKVREAVSQFSGVKLSDDIANGVYPMPLDTSNQDLVYVGRIRKDLTSPNALSLFCCGDQLIKGAAGNAVQIAFEVLKYID